MSDENNMADVTTEEDGFENESDSEAGDGTSTDSPAENNEDGENSDSGAEENNQQDDDKVPFHQHPRWKEREKNWQDKFNEQETRHAQAIEDLRKEIGGNKSNEDRPEKVPEWFGGTQEQWEKYCEHENAREERAINKALERITQSKTAEDKAVKEATDFMRDEISAIESDKDLNPKGEKIDPNKLLKIVMENDLVDSQGRWNYKAGYRLMKQSSGSTQPNVQDRKKLAGVTTSNDHKGNDKPSAFKTADDFKKEKPW